MVVAKPHHATKDSTAGWMKIQTVAATHATTTCRTMNQSRPSILAAEPDFSLIHVQDKRRVRAGDAGHEISAVQP